MKLKIVAAGAVLIGAMLAAAGITQAANPVPGIGPQDHSFSVAYEAGRNAGDSVDINVTLALGTNSTGEDTGFFHDATTTYRGIERKASQGAPGAVIGERVGSISFAIETNQPTATTLQGQVTDCGPGVTASTASQITPIFAAAKDANQSIGTIGTGPSVTEPPKSEDQVFDPANGAMPMGIRRLPDWYTPVLASLGLTDPVTQVNGRGMAIATILGGASFTSVNFLTLDLQDGSVPPNITTYVAATVLADPRGAFNPNSQTTITCPPFTSTVNTFGDSLPGSNPDDNSPLGDDGADWTACRDYFGDNKVCSNNYNLAVGGSVVQKFGTVAGTYPYEIAVSQNPDMDNDGILSTWDNCETVSNVAQTDANSNGLGDACQTGTGYTNVQAAAATNGALGTCLLPTASPPFPTCQDADQDGAINNVDNCPLTPNASEASWLTTGAGDKIDQQSDNDRDGVGNACDPAPNIPGDGNGYAAVTFEGGTNLTPAWTGAVGTYVDWNDVCARGFTIAAGGAGAAVTPGTATCEAANADDQGRLDSNNNGIADFHDTGSGNACMRDFAADSNGDGYSDSDHTNPAGGACTYGGITFQRNTDPLGNDDGCYSGQKVSTNISKADINADASVNGLDLSQLAGQFTKFWFLNSDPAARADLNGDHAINGLDLSRLASVFTQSLAANCTNIVRATRATNAATGLDTYTIGWDRVTGGPNHTIAFSCTGTTTITASIVVVGNSGRFDINDIPTNARPSCSITFDGNAAIGSPFG